MITHTELGDTTFKRIRNLQALILKGEVQLAGNSKLKIYGTLSCSSGKRMKTDNRIFFASETEAKNMGYRPCGHCMREKYLGWKSINKKSPVGNLSQTLILHTVSNPSPRLHIFEQSAAMFKQILFFLLLIAAALSSKAQTADTLFSKLADFDLARFNNDGLGAIRIGEQIMKDTAKLNPKTRTSFFDRMARLYEDDEQDAKALTFYQKVAAAEPDYYVAQRALGYLYDDAAEDIHLKLYQTKKDDPAYPALFDSYKKGVLKALPHLEKAQACDPDDDTLDLIRTLYQNIHDAQGLNSLNDRLVGLSKNRIDILKDK